MSLDVTIPFIRQVIFEKMSDVKQPDVKLNDVGFVQFGSKYVEISPAELTTENQNSKRVRFIQTIVILISEEADENIDRYPDLLRFAGDLVLGLYDSNNLIPEKDPTITHVDGTTEELNRKNYSISIVDDSIRLIPQPVVENRLSIAIEMGVISLIGQSAWEPREVPGENPGDPPILLPPRAIFRFSDPYLTHPLRRIFLTGAYDPPELVAEREDNG